MPDKCCVPNCTTNYKNSKTGYSSVFRFPRDEALRKKWVDNIPRKDFQPSKWSVVCVKHFPENMVLAEETIKDIDGNVRTFLKTKVTLKPGAVPEIFPGLSSYFKKKKKKKRADSASCSKELHQLKDEKVNEVLHKDIIKNFEDLCEKLEEKKHIFSGWNVQIDFNFVLFYCCDFNDLIPKIVSSVKISKDMTCTVVVNNNLLSKSQLSWILPTNSKISHWAVLEKILFKYNKDNLGKISEGAGDLISQIDNKFCLLIDIIKSDDKYSGGDVPKQLNFILEQFNLSVSNSHTYSLELKEWASMIHMYSPSAYQAIRDSSFLVLPHPKHLQRLNTEIDSSPKISMSVEVK